MAHRVSLLLLLTLAMTVAGVTSVAAHTAVPTPTVPAEPQPGDLIRWQSIGDIDGHPAWRILFVSSSPDGEPTPISGLIATPAETRPGTALPLLAVGHPTAGLGQHCAPSLEIAAGEGIMAQAYRSALRPYLDAGYAIVMPDYQGLGVAGEPSYMVGAVEGRNLLDAIRAAAAFPMADLSSDVSLIGHSQGGHAVAFALQLQPSYAPDVDIAAAVLLAPALDPRAIYDRMLADDTPRADVTLVLFVLAAWSQVYAADLAEVATPLGAELIEGPIASACLSDGGALASQYPPSALLLPEPSQAWLDLAAHNTPSAGRWPAPVLILHGDADEIIAPPVITDVAEALCTAGTAVDLGLPPGVDHLGILTASRDTVLAWLAERRTGLASQQACHWPGWQPASPEA